MDVFEKGNFYGTKLHPSNSAQGIPDADDFSNFLGLGNPEKRAARKQAKAEKKLEKAEHANPKKAARLRAAAGRKLGKVEKINQRYGLNPPSSSVDVGTQNENDSVLNTTNPIATSQAATTQVAATAATITTEQPQYAPMYEDTNSGKAPVDYTRMAIYGGIGLATIFVVGVLLSRQGELKMAKN